MINTITNKLNSFSQLFVFVYIYTYWFGKFICVSDPYKILEAYSTVDRDQTTPISISNGITYVQMNHM